MLFKLGQIVATPAAIVLCDENDTTIMHLVQRHATGDWGDLDQSDIAANVRAVQWGNARIFSSYNVGKGKVWVITEGDNSSTCVLTPSCY